MEAITISDSEIYLSDSQSYTGAYKFSEFNRRQLAFPSLNSQIYNRQSNLPIQLLFLSLSLTLHTLSIACKMAYQQPRAQRIANFQKLAQELKAPGADPSNILTRLFNGLSQEISKLERDNAQLREESSTLAKELAQFKNQLEVSPGLIGVL
jgi:septal ring factor EnvC (AmiA/AmiB activator)